MPRILRDLKIDEVSGVDKGAGRGVKIMLMKRDGGNDGEEMTAEDIVQATGALAKSLCSILADDAVTDPQAQIDKSISQFKAHISGSPEHMETTMTPEEITKLVNETVTKATDPLKADIAKRDDEIAILKMSDKQKAHFDGLDDDAKKKFKAMSPDEKDAACKKSDDTAADPVAKKIEDISKVFTSKIEVLEKRNAEFELREQKVIFAKRAVESGLKEEDGEVMRKAFSGDPDAQVALLKRQTETIAAYKEQAKSGKLFSEFGKQGGGSATAYGELQAKAGELRKSDPKLTEAQAFTKAYTDPANREVVERYKDEQVRKINGATA